MERQLFVKFIEEKLYDIVDDEYHYLTDKYEGTIIKNKLARRGSIETGELYYLFDKHKLQCKDHMGAHAIVLDRHKIAAIFMCMVIDYAPLQWIENSEVVPQEVLTANVRIAFRLACTYNMISLDHSFELKMKELEGLQSNEAKNNCNAELLAWETQDPNKYKQASQKLRERGYPYFPLTRKELESYFDNYILVVHNVFCQINTNDEIPPYTLFADTFYWMDVYAKLSLGIPVGFDNLENGLRRQPTRSK